MNATEIWETVRDRYLSTKREPEWLPQNILDQLSANSFNRYYHCVYSQCGEDGIIEEIFKRLNISQGFCVEFGAYDGVSLSNTRALWEKGWTAVMIEMNPFLFSLLTKVYDKNERSLLLNYFITWREDDSRGLTFDQIAEKHFADREIDFLSIDIDGADYLILENLKCRPKVICIEADLCWHPLARERIPDVHAISGTQQPLFVMIDIAKKKGYSPLCTTGNLFLIRDDLFYHFENTSSDELTLWMDAWKCTPWRQHIIQHRNSHPVFLQFQNKELEETYPVFKDF